MQRLVAVFALVTVTVTGVPVFADTPTPLKVKRDTRLRLYLSDGGRLIEGRLKDTDDGSITVDMGSGRSERFSRDQLRSVSYRTGGRDRVKGAKIGGIITGAAGVIACAVALSNEPDTGSPGCDQCAMGLGICGVAAALPGAAIGFAIGTTGGDWHRVRPDGLLVAGAPSSRGATAALTVRFGR
jgi:hypothetical protein